MKRALALACLLLAALPLSAQRVPGPTAAGRWPWPLVGDINGDGLDDVIDGSAVRLNGGGVLLPPVSLNISGRVLDVLDLNGDHAVDLLVTASDSIYGPYSLWINDGHGNFSSVPSPSVGPVGINNAVLPPLIADFDGDGKDDLVLFHPAGPGVEKFELTFLRSRGDGTFEQTGSSTGDMTPVFSEAKTRQHLTVGDLNGDGHPDLVLRGMDMITFLFGHGDGTFDPPITRYLPLAFGQGEGIHIADIDGDGNADLVWPDPHARLRVFFGDGHGNFGRMASIKMGEAYGTWDDEPRMLALLHYSSSKRFDVAVGAHPGLVVTFTYANGSLHEVAREQLLVAPPSPFPGIVDTSREVNVFAGKFRAGAPRDLFAFELSGADAPFAELVFVNGPAQQPSTRVRIAGRPITQPVRKDTLSLRVVTTGCADAGEEIWQLQREGVFAAGTAGDRVVEAVTDDLAGQISFREVGPGGFSFLGTLSLAADGHYVGAWESRSGNICSLAMPRLDAYLLSSAH